MQLRPIRNEEHETALAEIYALWNAEPGTAEADQLDVLMLLVEDYEKQRYPIEPPDPIDLILFVMDANGLKQKDMLPYFGTRAHLGNSQSTPSFDLRNDPQVGGRVEDPRRFVGKTVCPATLF